MSVILMLLLISSTAVYAADLGTFGSVFPIMEEDLMVVLQKMLTEAEFDDGKRQKIKDCFLETAKKPKGIKLPKAVNLRNFNFDPTVCINEDVSDLEKVIVAKGTKVNPLEKVSLSEDLLFFDGNDTQQVDWARNHPGIWILTDGNPLKLEESEERAVYFDQSGYLTSRIGIRALPARVYQTEKILHVEEVPCL